MGDKISVSAIVVTRNEEKNLARCLAALECFDEIIVVDSQSTDSTVDVACSFGASVVSFEWNGTYPKKRQWCLDTLPLKNDHVFFVDADEEVTAELRDEIGGLDWNCAGYFVRGIYVMNKKPLYRGLKNNKLCLFDRRLMEFPVVNDLDIPGMGEIEGHYQPVFKTGCFSKTATLKHGLLHHAMDDRTRYEARHKDYALWEKQMRLQKAYPEDPSFIRRLVKTVFSLSPLRPVIAFVHSYIICMGFLMGRQGFLFAKSRFDYYRLTQ